MNKTSFFTDLNEVLDGQPAQLVVTFKENGQCVASFLPTRSGSVGGKFKPLNLNGPVKDFDEQFLQEIHSAVAIVKTGSIAQNKNEFVEAVGAEAPAVKKTDKKPTESKEKILGNLPEGVTQEQADKVHKLKGQAKGMKFIAEKTGLTEALINEVLACKVKANTKQLDIEEEAAKVPVKVSHKPEDLANFKKILTNQLHDAEDVLVLAPRKLERELPEEQKIELQGDITRARSTVENCKDKLKQIEAGTFGTRKEQTELVPVEELLTQLNPKA